MQLTGRQIVDDGIVTNYIKEAVQQQGVDVRLKNIFSLVGTGYVPSKGKTKKPHNIPIADNYFIEEDGEGHICFYLEPGYYEVEFEEACNIPNNCALNFKTRSSLVRCGALIHSGQFDAGFQTKNMGALLHVIRPIFLERGSRLAQAVVTESYPVENKDLYDGQWQNDKQRK